MIRRIAQIGGLLLVALLSSAYSCNPPAPVVHTVTLSWDYDCTQFGSPKLYDYGVYSPNGVSYGTLPQTLNPCVGIQHYTIAKTTTLPVTVTTIFYVRAQFADNSYSVSALSSEKVAAKDMNVEIDKNQ